MAVSPNTDGYFSRSTNPPDNAAGWTMRCWMRITATEAAYRVLFALTGADGIFESLGVNTSTAVLEFLHNAGGAFSDDDVLTMSVGTWYFVAIRMISGTQVEILYRAEGDSALSTTGVLTIANSPPPTWTDLWFLRSDLAGEEWSNGEAYAFALYNVALSAAQIWEESVRSRPRGPHGSLDSYLPLYSASGTDEGGLGRNWTANGTLAVNDAQPRISRGGGARARLVSTPPSAVTGAIAATLPGLTAALSGQVTDNVAVAAQLPGLTAALQGTVTDQVAIAAQLPGLTAAVQGQVTNQLAVAATLPGLVAALRMPDPGSVLAPRRVQMPRGRGNGRRFGVP